MVFLWFSYGFPGSVVPNQASPWLQRRALQNKPRIEAETHGQQRCGQEIRHHILSRGHESQNMGSREVVIFQYMYLTVLLYLDIEILIY